MTRTRRGFLRAGLAAVALGSLGGCTDSSNNRQGGRGRDPGTGLGGTPTPGEFAWADPPQHPNTITTSQEDGLQAGLDSLEPQSTLVIDDGPYNESFSLPAVDDVTISGGRGGATITNPGVGGSLIDTPDWSLDRTSCEALQEGATTLTVGDASIFSAGDDVRIHDPNEFYKGIGPGDLRNTHSQRKGEFAVVTGTDTSTGTITLRSGTHQSYNNPSGTLEAARINWGATNIHIHNLTLDGGVGSPSDNSSSDFRGMDISQCKNVWVTGVRSQNWNKDGWVANETLNYFVNGGHVENVDRYGVGISAGTTHARVQGVTGNSAGRYLIQSGGGGTNWPDVSRPSYDIIAKGCHAENQDFVTDAHFGCESVEYRGCTSSGTDAMKIRGIGQSLVGEAFEGDGGGNTIQSTQLVENALVEGVSMVNGGDGWTLWPKEGQPFSNLRMADCRFTEMDGTPFNFRTDENGNAPQVSGLEVVNSSWNGEWIDEAMIEGSDGFASSISYTASYPSGMAPADYFGGQ